jgi:hypothetical protein
MSDPTFLEQWVCMLRVGEYMSPGQCRLRIDESTVDSLVASFKGPMPVQLEFANERDPSMFPPMPHTGSVLVALEKRFDGKGGYLAGLIRTPHVSIVYRTSARDWKTGVPIEPRLIGASYIQHPLSPIESATDPITSESAFAEQIPPRSR